MNPSEIIAHIARIERAISGLLVDMQQAPGNCGVVAQSTAAAIINLDAERSELKRQLRQLMEG